MEKERVFTVMVNGAANSLLMIQFCYFDRLTGQYKWVDKSNKVRSGEAPNKNVQIFTFSKANPTIKYVVEPNASSSRKQEVEDLINFWKNNPEVGKRTVGDKVDSYPSENHKRTFESTYRSNPYDALPPSEQRLVYVDEVEVSKEKSKILKMERSVLNVLAEFKEIEGLLAHYAYMLGINPEGYELDEIENLVYDKISNEGSHEEFLKMTGDNVHNDPVKIAVHIAIANGIVSRNPSGIFQFEGNLVGKGVDDLAYHFKQNRNDWNVLIARLGDKAANLPNEQNAITHAATLKVKAAAQEVKETIQEEKKAPVKAKTPANEKLEKFLEEQEEEHPFK